LKFERAKYLGDPVHWHFTFDQRHRKGLEHPGEPAGGMRPRNVNRCDVIIDRFDARITDVD